MLVLPTGGPRPGETWRFFVFASCHVSIIKTECGYCSLLTDLGFRMPFAHSAARYAVQAPRFIHSVVRGFVLEYLALAGLTR